MDFKLWHSKFIDELKEFKIIEDNFEIALDHYRRGFTPSEAALEEYCKQNKQK